MISNVIFLAFSSPFCVLGDDKSWTRNILYCARVNISPETDYTVPKSVNNKESLSSHFRCEAYVRKINNNRAMHLGAIAQWISRLHAWVIPIITVMPRGLVSKVHSAFLRAVELQSSDWIAVGHRAPPNECSANHKAEKKNMFVSLSCGGFVK